MRFKTLEESKECIENRLNKKYAKFGGKVIEASIIEKVEAEVEGSDVEIDLTYALKIEFNLKNEGYELITSYYSKKHILSKKFCDEAYNQAEETIDNMLGEINFNNDFMNSN